MKKIEKGHYIAVTMNGMLVDISKSIIDGDWSVMITKGDSLVWISPSFKTKSDAIYKTNLYLIQEHKTTF